LEGGLYPGHGLGRLVAFDQDEGDVHRADGGRIGRGLYLVLALATVQMDQRQPLT